MKIEVVIDHPHHYRARFFNRLSDELELRVVYVASNGLERKGLLLPGEKRFDSIVLGSLLYNDVLGNLKNSARLCLAALPILYRRRADVMVVHGYSNPVCWIALCLQKMRNKPVVIWAESNVFDRPRVWYLEAVKRLFLALCDQGHVYGGSAAQYFRLLGMPESRIYVTQPTILEEHFSQVRHRARLDNEIRLLYVGRLSEEKNLEFFLSCLADHVSRRKQDGPSRLRLTIAGFGSLSGPLANKVSLLGLSAYVHLTGQLQQSEVAAQMAENDIFVLPSLREPYGLVVLEAMWASMPVIVSTQCGCATDLVSERNGWLLNPTDAALLGDLLERLETLNQSDVIKMGLASREIANRFDTERSVELTVSALKSVVYRAGLNA